MALTWALADPTMDKMTAPSVRKRGCTDRGETDFYALSAEQLIYLCKYSYVLVARQPGVSAEEVIASLPTVEEIVGAVVTLATCSPYHAAFGLLCNLCALSLSLVVVHPSVILTLLCQCCVFSHAVQSTSLRKCAQNSDARISP